MYKRCEEKPDSSHKSTIEKQKQVVYDKYTRCKENFFCQ